MYTPAYTFADWGKLGAYAEWSALLYLKSTVPIRSNYIFCFKNTLLYRDLKSDEFNQLISFERPTKSATFSSFSKV